MKLALLVLAFLIALIFAWLNVDRPKDRDRLSPAAVARIRNGQTHRLEVLTLLGKPQWVETQVPMRQPADAEPLPAKFVASEIWVYWSKSDEWSRKKKSGRGSSRYEATIYFDEKGKVLDYKTEVTH